MAKKTNQELLEEYKEKYQDLLNGAAGDEKKIEKNCRQTYKRKH